jgi:6-phosphogluconolactonase
VFADDPAPGSKGLRPEAIGPTALVQVGPACHDVAFDRSQRWILATDNGDDRIYVYPFDPTSRMLKGKSFPTTPGTAPRHFAVHPSAPYFVITNEREPSVSSFHFDADSGEVRHVQTIATVPENEAAAPAASSGAAQAGPPRISPADIKMHPNGKFVYSSNRMFGPGGRDTIASFAIDRETGRLRRVDVVETGGRGQRELKVEPSGRFLFACNPQSNDVIAFALDADTGRMTRTARTEVQRPMAIDFAML